MPFDDLLGSGYLETMKRRLRGETEELVWPRQVRDLLKPHLQKGTTVLEAGCCLGTAYRAFEATDIEYIGLDFEPKYLEVAKEWYQGNPNVSFIEHDIAKGPLPLMADIVICSATLEHCISFQPALKHLADAAKHILVLRTFLGDEEDIAYNLANGKRFHTNQYAFRDILGYLWGKGFAINIYRDKYTDSVPQFQNKMVRTCYIIRAEKRVNE